MSDQQPPQFEDLPTPPKKSMQDLVSWHQQAKFRTFKLRQTARQTNSPQDDWPQAEPLYPPVDIEAGPRWQWNLITGVNIASLLLIVVSTLVIVGATAYAWIAVQLPPAEELRSRSLQFATTQILDREGNLLWEIIDPTGGRRTNITLDRISPHLINATLATEDRFFYLNVGVDPIAIMRATFTNLSEKEIVSGASTITQQLARNVFLTPKERTDRSFSRKLREAVLAM